MGRLHPLMGHGMLQPILVIPFREISARMRAAAFGAGQGAGDDDLAESDQMLRFQAGQQVGVEAAALVHDLGRS